MNLTNRRLERLNTKLNSLQNELYKETTSLDNFDDLVRQIKELETEKKEIELKNRLDKVNKKHSEKRDLITELFNIEFPAEDITTNSGEFHATKVKKFKALNELLSKYNYVTARYRIDSDGDGFYEDINIRGEKIKLVNYRYETGKTFLSHFESLEAAFNANGVKAKPVKLSELKRAKKIAKKESEKIKKSISEMNAKLKDLDIYFYEREELIKRYTESGVYTYE